MLGPGWDQLSESSKKALRFAWAAAQERTSEDGRSGPDTEVDSFDVLVGILLAHPGTSEAEQTFRRFELVAGQALPPGYPNLTADQLNRHLANSPEDDQPPTTRDVDEIVRGAVELGVPASPESVAELRSLWVALLQTSNPASTAIRDLLERRGVNSSVFVTSAVDWLTRSPGDDYASVLGKFSTTPVDIVNYKADRSRRSVGSALATQVDDFVGVSAEVDAFAYLLASRNLEPPLAVGLFGDWGSGKSYFLDAIKRRIDQLIQSDSVRERKQIDTRFWKHIVQVEFNAWHYVEGDLWSSLVDHIFNQLSLASDSATDNIVVKRQRYLLGQLKSTASTMKQLEAHKLTIQHDLARHKYRVDLLRRAQKAALAKLTAERAHQTLAIALGDAAGQVLAVLATVELGTPSQPTTLGEAATTLATARTELEQGWSIVRPFLKKPWWLVGLLVCLFAAPLLALAIEQWGHSSAAATLGGLATVLTVFGGAVGASSRWVHKRLDRVSAAQLQVDADIARADAQAHARVDAAQLQLDKANAHLEEAERAQASLTEKLASIERDLDKKPQEVLNEFLHERLQAGDYRKRLGVPAIIRRDFKDLADLISHQNDYLTTDSEKSKQEIRAQTEGRVLDENKPDERALIVNRIILYIDDLDRCPDGKVIEVLQAVHMLLAFPLFVVVVAVDARWLAHALQSRYPALAGGDFAASGRPARPDDYLEKIFQIPFWVSDLSDRSRGAIVRGLLAEHVLGSGGAAPTGENGQITLQDKEKLVLEQMIGPRSGPPLLDVTALQVTRDELLFLERLTPLMGHTPRSIKRFVNLYQLLKILRHGRGGTNQMPPDEYVAALLLAIAEGQPALAATLFNEIKSSPTPTPTHSVVTLTMLLQGPAFVPFVLERAPLTAWLAGQEPAWQNLDVCRLADLAADVKRFLFRVMETANADGVVAPRPQLVHVLRER